MPPPSDEPITATKFWRCISILLRNFHAINKKIFACKIYTVHKVLRGLRDINVWEYDTTSGSTLEHLQLNANLESILATQESLTAYLENDVQSQLGCEGFILTFNLLTKKLAKNIEAIGILDFSKNLYTCKFLDSNNFEDFSVELFDSFLKVNILTQRLDVEVSERWCKFVLKPKLLNWCSCATETKGRQHVSSLQLIDVEAYNNLYKDLKRKYSEKALKFWEDAKESTDPLKFIYEDLAIAAYLICLWKSTAAPTAFADLGCGNGLLVYILCEEGYEGFGYDIRARKLWSLYPQTLHLIEQAVEPEIFKLPSNVDWLIGNHSDELSPWLPVLAATLSNKMRYFLLPCCAFEFSGSKFQRRNSRLSGYADFMDYVKRISDLCGYKTQLDRLKIPSTKRIALVGIERLHSQSEYAAQARAIWQFVRSERTLHPHGLADDIKLREKYETVRNCTQIDKCIIDGLVVKIFMLLLEYWKPTDHVKVDTWNAGGRLNMCSIVKMLSKEDLKHIKSECGGIKTLLRNKHEIFEFCGNDLIGIRKPQLHNNVENRPLTVKKRVCFFQQHHPNGCPLPSAECTFIHA